MRILITEDDLTLRMALAGVLAKSGHDVICATNGNEALEILKSPAAPSLVILDWMMPEMDGIEVLRNLRTMETDEPAYVIMLTSRGGTGDIVAGLEAGADDYVTKPFEIDELKARIEVGRRIIQLRDALRAKAEELAQALNEIGTLRGIVPICMHCKKIRNDKGFWEQVEAYVGRHTEVKFSHGICDECISKHWPDEEGD